MKNRLPAWVEIAFLYRVVLSVEPERAAQIGTYRAGSTVCDALECCVALRRDAPPRRLRSVLPASGKAVPAGRWARRSPDRLRNELQIRSGHDGRPVRVDRNMKEGTCLEPRESRRTYCARDEARRTVVVDYLTTHLVGEIR